MTNVVRPVVSVVLGTYNRLPFLQAAIAGIRSSEIDVPYEIIVVDGGSTDGTIDWLVRQRDIIAIVHHNREMIDDVMSRKRSWGYFINLGFRCAEGRYLCLLSDDAVVHPDTIANGVMQFDRELDAGRKPGAVAFYWRSWPEETQYRICRTLADHLMVNHGLFLREAVAEVGWIEEDLYSFYCADGDLSLKLWHAGYEVAGCESALVEHFESADIAIRQDNLATVQVDWQRYTAKWSGIYFDPEKPYAGQWITLIGVPGRDAARLFPESARQKRTEQRGRSRMTTAMRQLRRLLRPGSAY